ncbi:MAG: hypothetical protein JWP16_1203 [Alphaproteobacteria bacterium]|nr:hypothetical protein [Alphaproteobacteria bacterium]
MIYHVPKTAKTVLRMIGIALYALVALSIFYKGVVNPDTRDPALVGIVAALCLPFGLELSRRGADPDQLIQRVGGPFLGFCLVMLGWHVLVPPPLPPTGALLPAGEPMPAMTCAARPGDLVMAFGSDRVIGSGDGPFTPFASASCPGPRMARTRQGLVVSAFGYDWYNDIAYGIRDNAVTDLWAPGLHARRPDPHTILVLDRFEHEVLYIRYLNRDAVRIRGRFLCGEEAQSVITDDRILVGGVRISGVMFGQHATAGHVCARLTPGMPYGVQILSR